MFDRKVVYQAGSDSLPAFWHFLPHHPLAALQPFVVKPLVSVANRGKGLTGGHPAPDPLAPLPTLPAAHQVTNSGSGAIAQGGGVAAGERGVAIRGNATGNQMITGDGNRISRHTTTTNVNTGGGTYVDGNVNTGGGDFVGRSTHTHHNRTFDQRGQTVAGSQTNIAGDVKSGGGPLNSGFMGATQPDLATQLRQLRVAILQAGEQGLLDEESVIDAEGAYWQRVACRFGTATPIDSHTARPTPNCNRMLTDGYSTAVVK